MTRLLAAAAAFFPAVLPATPAEAGRTLITTIRMATFVERCEGAGGTATPEENRFEKVCTLPSGAAVRCAAVAVGALVCEVLIERRGRGVTAASIAAMPDGTHARRLMASSN